MNQIIIYIYNLSVIYLCIYFISTMVYYRLPVIYTTHFFEELRLTSRAGDLFTFCCCFVLYSTTNIILPGSSEYVDDDDTQYTNILIIIIIYQHTSTQQHQPAASTAASAAAATVATAAALPPMMHILTATRNNPYSNINHVDTIPIYSLFPQFYPKQKRD